MRLTLLLALALIAVPFHAQAQDAVAVPEKLSLKDAIALAVTHNARHRQSYVAVQDARSRRLAAGEVRKGTLDTTITQRSSDASDPRNTLGATVGPNYNISSRSGAALSLTGGVPWLSHGESSSSDLGVGLSMPLTRGRGRVSDTHTTIERADLTLRNEELTHFINQQSLVQQVITAYYNAVRATELVKVQQSNVAVTQQATDDAQKRLDAGLITEIDLTRAQLTLAEAKELLANQIQAQHNALDDLVLLLGMPVGSLPTLTEPVSYVPVPVDLAASLREALANRPELEQFRVQKAQADVDMRVSKDRKRTSANLVANLTNAGFGLFTGGGLSRILTSVLGLRVSMPIGKVSLRENQAQAERQIDLLDHMEAFEQQQIVDEVRGLARAADTAKSNIDLLDANMAVAQKSLKIAQRLIEEGLSDNRNYLDAQQSLTRTEGSLLDAKVTYLLTMVSLRRALGQDLLKGYQIAPLELPEHPFLQAASGSRPNVRPAISDQR